MVLQRPFAVYSIEGMLLIVRLLVLGRLVADPVGITHGRTSLEEVPIISSLGFLEVVRRSRRV